MSRKCACGCGRTIPYQKRPREKLYYSPACRQRACRTRNKDKHNIERIVRESTERFYLKVHQDFHRETWQDELEEAQKRIAAYQKDWLDRGAERDEFTLGILADLSDLRKYVHVLEDQLADKEAEIVRLNTLLEDQAKKKTIGGITDEF